jgi:uncharacterized membrane protein YcaP (DUF421 family)
MPMMPHMSGDAKTIPDAMLLVATLMVWNYLIDVGSYYSKTSAKFVEPSPLLLVENGQYKLRNMRKEYVTKEEIQAQLREHDITDIMQVKKMTMERDGEISVVKKSG